MAKNYDYWNEALKSSPKSFKRWHKEEENYLKKTIIASDAFVLDVGCGDGRSVDQLLSITGNIFGVDHDSHALIRARTAFMGYPSVKFLKCEASQLLLSNSMFDYVICMGTFANFAEQKHAALGEMKRVLKGDGKIIISVYSEDAYEERVKLYDSLGLEIKETNGSTVRFGGIIMDNISEQFSQSQLERIAFDAELKIENLIKVDIAYLCTFVK